ncbi:hypothetical protein H8959_002141 [Pygathrix nigripes]
MRQACLGNTAHAHLWPCLSQPLSSVRKRPELKEQRSAEVSSPSSLQSPRLKFPELKFKYVEEEQPEEFFIPYVWSLVYNSAVGLYWNPQDIQLFTMDSD